jgi:1-acyl-sn-glycerol-3-phosphate acyltransferase
LTVVMTEGAERLSRGFSIVIFPQTTRTDSFDPSKFNTIGAKLAARAKVPLVPLALRTSMWGTGRWLKDFGPIDPSRPVDFAFGEPIAPEGTGDAAHRATVEFITGAFSRWEDSGTPG